MFEDLLRELNRMIPGNPGPKAAFDIAVHDAMARYAKLPLNALLGRALNDLETTITVGLEDRDETLRQAETLRKRGVTSIKFKIGGEPNRDVERIHFVRDNLGNDFRLTVDANQGYTRRQAIFVAKKLEDCDVDFFEQPVQGRNIVDLAVVRKQSPIPIMADESVHTARDALAVVRHEAADMINIKLMKSGGITEAKRIAAIAEAADIPCMVGCMVETKLGVAAGCHFATSQTIVKFADLDSHTSLARDIVTGGVETTGSKNHIIEGVGLAVDIQRSELEKGAAR
jgi:L-alanine-DL-glutamate epimerase-like enolase superfamily enzyme